ncbi:para-aminobenzoate synthase, (PABA) [Rhodotorula toruloides]|uniref:aminodeoxychorismate synthase n=1 Tax=Rhodotorula toruloides TaxID=5286 RepID=A0A2T0AC74_RHOTO|nr:para-aminobenzoate synthase [Rhodotorula toruloides]
MASDTGRRRLPTVLVLDFWDSYTLNVLRLVHQIAAGIHFDGEQEWDCTDWQDRVVVLNVDSLSWDSFEHDILPHIDCVVLGPGPGTPHRQADFSWPTRLIQQVGDRVPVFGLCLGLQGLATSFGGTVVEAFSPKHGQISLIRHTAGLNDSRSLFTDVPSEFEVVQYNSLVVDPKSLPAELEAIAWTEDASGADEIMALRHRERPLYGVQFHPESISSTCGARILSNFFHLALDFHASASPSRHSSSNLPRHILSLSTACRPPPPRPSSSNPNLRYESRTEKIESDRDWRPQRVFEELVKGRSPLGEVWLDSARPTALPQYAHLFAPQATFAYSVASHSLLIRDAAASRQVHLPAAATFFTTISDAQQALQHATHDSRPDGCPPCPVGFVGSIGYEMKDVTLPLSARPRSRLYEDDKPEAVLAFADRVLSYSYDSGEWFASGLVVTAQRPEEADDPTSGLGAERKEWDGWLSTIRQTLASTPPRTPSQTPAPLPTDFAPDQSRSSYMESIELARQSIIAGNAYELCLTTQFRSTLPADSPLVADPYPLYLQLRATNPAPYSAYFYLLSSDFTLLSSSPERFIRIDRDGRADMKPIKGTVRRALDDFVEDERRKQALEADTKERAENLMIVDLIRNDLLASCTVESVEVPKLMKVETYQTVHQLVTTVVGQLGKGVAPFEAMARAFPPGSMTGAPKLRSLQLLDELERQVPRGAYSGVFGYLAVDGSSDWSVVIRTLVKRGRELTLGAGGAITHLSDPAKEWEEVLTKVDAVLGRKAS